jgi:hypothetical protein
MWKSKGIRWVVVGLVTLVMLMGTGCTMFNNPPEINSLTPSATSVAPGDSCIIDCSAGDPDGDTLTYEWAVPGGAISGEGSMVTWVAPTTEGSYNIKVTVSDGKGGTASDSCAITVEVKFGSIDIKSSPSGAIVYLDGVDTGNITPYVINNVDTGSHTIKLVLYHHKYREEAVTVDADETTYINWSLAHAPEQTVTIQPGADTGKDASIDIAYPDHNYGSQYEIAAGRGTADTVRAYIEFDLSTVPENSVVTDAELGLYYYRTVGGTVTAPIGAYTVLGSWNESNINWNNQPSFAVQSEYIRIVPATVTNNFIYWSLDDLVKGWADNTIRNYGIVLKDTDESTTEVWKGFYSSDWGTVSQRPKLVVKYYDPTP